MDGLGSAVVALCLGTEDGFREALRFGVCEDWFPHDFVPVWQHCLDVIKAGGKPNRVEIETRFGATLGEPREGLSIEAAARLLRDRAMTADLKPVFNGAQALIAAGKPLEAAESMLGVAAVRAKYVKSAARPQSFKSDYKARILDYKVRQLTSGLVGSPWPWPFLNEETGGLHRGWMHVMAAMTSVGKTWLLSVIAKHLRSIGHNPLVVTMEMNPSRVATRIDSVDYDLPHKALLRGSLSPEDELRWMRALYEFGESDSLADITIIGKETVNTVSEVELYWRDGGFSEVLIDGGYRLKSSSKRVNKSSEWGDQVEVIRDIQFAAERTDVPWFVTTQMGAAQEKGKSLDSLKGSRWNVRYAREWLIDPDVVLIGKQDEDLKLIHQMEIDIAKFRDGDGTPKKFRIHFDGDTRDYSEVKSAETVAATADKLETHTYGRTKDTNRGWNGN